MFSDITFTKHGNKEIMIYVQCVHTKILPLVQVSVKTFEALYDSNTNFSNSALGTKEMLAAIEILKTGVTPTPRLTLHSRRASGFIYMRSFFTDLAHEISHERVTNGFEPHVLFQCTSSLCGRAKLEKVSLCRT